ncbi:MAG TPA: hypothetical protein VMR45_01495, partial [Patescibacteria group bacterium]|nr:hypothetical protein [Patescibacteria group bacterium]
MELNQMLQTKTTAFCGTVISVDNFSAGLAGVALLRCGVLEVNFCARPRSTNLRLRYLLRKSLSQNQVLLPNM